MEKSFSWKNFDRMSKALESLGYVVIALGPVLGVAFIIFGNTIFMFTGIVVIFASFLIALYHISFSLLMNGMRDLTKQIEEYKLGIIENSTPE